MIFSSAVLHEIEPQQIARIAARSLSLASSAAKHGRKHLGKKLRAYRGSARGAGISGHGKVKAKVEPREFEIYQRVRYPLPETHPLVSIIIPSRDQSALLEKCVDSILHKNDYTNFEIIILENNSVEEQTHELYRRLRKDRRIQIIESAGEFNFSHLINLGASRARGSIFLLLNNDVEMMNADCLSELVSQVSRPEIGIVGARLLVS